MTTDWLLLLLLLLLLLPSLSELLLPMLCFVSILLFSLQRYNMADIAAACNLPGAFVFGAGAGSSRIKTVNCEVRLAVCVCHQLSFLFIFPFNNKTHL